MELEEILQKENGMLMNILLFIVILFWECSMWIG